MRSAERRNERHIIQDTYRTLLQFVFRTLNRPYCKNRNIPDFFGREEGWQGLAEGYWFLPPYLSVNYETFNETNVIYIHVYTKAKDCNFVFTKWIYYH